MKGLAEKKILCLMEEGGFYGFTNICTILRFFCVYVCVSDEHRRKLQVGEVMCETRFVKIYALQQKSERENYLREKSLKISKEKCSNSFGI